MGWMSVWARKKGRASKMPHTPKTTALDTATAVFGAYFKLQSFIFMPVFGLNNGMVPIISYNYGAVRLDRVRDTISPDGWNGGGCGCPY